MPRSFTASPRRAEAATKCSFLGGLEVKAKLECSRGRCRLFISLPDKVFAQQR